MNINMYEIGIWNCPIALQFDRHLGSTATDVPVEFQSNVVIETVNLAASRLQYISR